jgi:hypothetical protein
VKKPRANPAILAVAIRANPEEKYRHLGYVIVSLNGERDFIWDGVRIFHRWFRWRRDKKGVAIPFVALTDVSKMPPLKAVGVWPLPKKKQARKAA